MSDVRIIFFVGIDRSTPLLLPTVVEHRYRGRTGAEILLKGRSAGAQDAQSPDTALTCLENEAEWS